jgi:predicted transcriptional regulator
MSFSCENVARYILPLYRAFVAKELIKRYGFTQVKAAKKLGTTQAAISQYITAKRGRKGISNYEEIAPAVQEAAAKVAGLMAKSEMSREEFSDSFCDLCKTLQKAGKISMSRRRVKKK